MMAGAIISSLMRFKPAPKKESPKPPSGMQ
jgi:hypothetical protein